MDPTRIIEQLTVWWPGRSPVRGGPAAAAGTTEFDAIMAGIRSRHAKPIPTRPWRLGP